MRSRPRHAPGPITTEPGAWLDRLIAARPPGERRLPIFLCTGPEAGPFVAGYDARLVDDRGDHLVPHALVEGVDAADPDVAALDQIANQLRRTMPVGWGRLQLPSYRLLRDVLETEAPGIDVDERRLALRNRLFARYQQKRPEAGLPGSVVGALAPPRLAGLVPPLTLRLPRYVFGRRLAHGRRHRWLGEAMAPVIGRRGDYLDAALCLVRGGPKRGDRALVRRLLLSALLRDLDRATRRRRGWVAPFVVLLPEGPPELLQTLGELDDPRGWATLLVVAASDDDSPTVAARRKIVVLPVPDGGGDDAKLRPARPRRRKAVPLLAMSAAALVLLFALVQSGGDDDRCPRLDTDEDTDEQVGVGDGTLACRFFPQRDGLDDLGRELDDKHRDVERRIAEANAVVVANAEADPYRTVVFFAPLTVPTGPERNGQIGLTQLRGIAMAQAAVNASARNDRAGVPLRVVLANSGDHFAHGEDVARGIVDLAAHDDTVVGVVGIGQSREASRKAIDILGEAGLPVVAGPVTGDAMLDDIGSDGYYQVSARNERIAQVLTDFATSVPITGSPTAPSGSPELALARDAVIVSDPHDEYSDNLADDFAAAFGAAVGADGEPHRVSRRVEYAVVDGDAASASDGVTGEVSLGKVAEDTCAALDDPRDIVFFASRSPQLKGLLDNLARTPCADRGITVVAGPDLAKLVQDPRIRLADYDGFLRFYYPSLLFVAPGLAQQVDLSPTTLRFMTDYQELYPPGTTTFDIGNPANVYDALLGMSEAVELAAPPIMGPGSELTGPMVADALASGKVAFEGASGYIAFDRPDEHVPADKLVLVINVPVRSGGRNLTVELLCGRLTDDAEATAWGVAGQPCPTEG